MKLSILSAKKQMSNEAIVETSKAEKLKKAMAAKLKEDAMDVNPEAEVQELAKTAGVKVDVKRTAKNKKTAPVDVKFSKAIKPIKGTDEKPISKPTNKQKKDLENKESSYSLCIVDYSAKSIAVFGDTKPIKEELKALKGRFNSSLHPFGQDSSVPGWIFPAKARPEVEKLVSKYK